MDSIDHLLPPQWESIIQLSKAIASSGKSRAASETGTTASASAPKRNKRGLLIELGPQDGTVNDDTRPGAADGAGSGADNQYQ